MDLHYPPELLQFRDEVRTWLGENVPRDERPREAKAIREYDLAWQHTQWVGGWAASIGPKNTAVGALRYCNSSSGMRNPFSATPHSPSPLDNQAAAPRPAHLHASSLAAALAPWRCRKRSSSPATGREREDSSVARSLRTAAGRMADKKIRVSPIGVTMQG